LPHSDPRQGRSWDPMDNTRLQAGGKARLKQESNTISSVCKAAPDVKEMKSLLQKVANEMDPVQKEECLDSVQKAFPFSSNKPTYAKLCPPLKDVVRRATLGDEPGTVTPSFIEALKDAVTLMKYPMDLREAGRQTRGGALRPQLNGEELNAKSLQDVVRDILLADLKEDEALPESFPAKSVLEKVSSLRDTFFLDLLLILNMLLNATECNS
jgi:hypothetical protein